VAIARIIRGKLAGVDYTGGRGGKACNNAQTKSRAAAAAHIVYVRSSTSIF
jgi:hypothetical protein